MVQPFDPNDPITQQFFDGFSEENGFLEAPKMFFDGTQILKPVVQISHLGRNDGFDYFSAALKLKVLGPGSYAKGISVEGEDSGGNLIEAYNNNQEPYTISPIRMAFQVRPDSKVAINMRNDETVSAHVQIHQTDLFTRGVQVVAASDLAEDLIRLLDEDQLETIVVSAVGEFYASRNAFFFGHGIQVGDDDDDFGQGINVIGISDSAPPPVSGPTRPGVILQASNSRMRYWDNDSTIWRWPDGNLIPEVHELLAYNYDPAMAIGSAVFDEGIVYLNKILFHRSTSPTTVRFYVTAVALNPVNSYLGIYTTDGELLATSGDVSSQLTSLGNKSATLLNVPIFQPGYYYVAILCGSGPGLGPDLAITGAAAGIGNVNLSAPNLRFAADGFGQTSLPASIDMNGITPTDNQAWVGVA